MSVFTRNVFTLATGTAAAQALTILVAPVMTRIYQPAEYGVFALWSVVAIVAGLIASGKYEGAILLPEDDHAAAALVHLCAGLTIAVSLLLGLVFFWLGSGIAALFGVSELAVWLLAIPPVLIATNVAQSLGAWTNRRQAYPRLAVCRIAQGIVQIAVNIGLGLAGWGVAGLILGVLAGQVVGVGILGWQFWRIDRERHANATFARMREQARLHADFPKFTLGAELLNVLSNQMITLVLPRMFGMATLGWYSIGQRVIGVPTNLIGTAIGEVFRSKASRDYAEQGNCTAVYRTTLKHLVIAGIVPFALLLIAAPQLFSFVFGEAWSPAGEIARAVSLMYFLRFLVVPLVFTFVLARRQREDLLLQAWMLISSPVVLWLGYQWSHDVVVTLWCFSINFSLVYLRYLVRSYRFAQGASPVGRGAIA